MDSLIAIKGKDFIVMAADTVNAYSVLRMKVTSNIMSRTTMIKFGISMEKNYSLLEDNTQMFQYSQIIFKKTQLIYSIKTEPNYLLTIPLNSSDTNSPKLLEKGHIVLTVYQQVLKVIHQDCIGSIIWDLSQNLIKLLMDMLNFWLAAQWMFYKQR